MQSYRRLRIVRETFWQTWPRLRLRSTPFERNRREASEAPRLRSQASLSIAATADSLTSNAAMLNREPISALLRADVVGVGVSSSYVARILQLAYFATCQISTPRSEYVPHIVSKCDDGVMQVSAVESHIHRDSPSSSAKSSAMMDLDLIHKWSHDMRST